jgi:tRNA pseudouridine38-40 synthase
MNIHPKRFKLILEFDGSRYSGWQKQDDAVTVQGAVLDAAGKVFSAEADVQGSGRTDAGVHALMYGAHLETQTDLAPVEIMKRLNAALPSDIAVLDCKRAGARFHARLHCIGRSYCYQIARQKSALARHHVWQVTEPLDGELMREAAAMFVGMHDFTSFTDRQVIKKKSPLVMVHQCQVTGAGDLILFRIVGSHFLWKMVRRIAGVLVAVGKGELTEAELRRFLHEPVVLKQYTAPAQGLFFERAFYDQDELDGFLTADELKPVLCR